MHGNEQIRVCDWEYLWVAGVLRSSTLRVFDQLFTTPLVNISLVCPLFPYYYSMMKSIGLWSFPFFSLNQSSAIHWTRYSRLAHLTATLVLQSFHIVICNTPALLPILFSFTSIELKALLWQSPKKPPTVLRLPSIFPTTINPFIGLGPMTLPSSRALQIFHLQWSDSSQNHCSCVPIYFLSSLWIDLNYSSYLPSNNL